MKTSHNQKLGERKKVNLMWQTGGTGGTQAEDALPGWSCLGSVHAGGRRLFRRETNNFAAAHSLFQSKGPADDSSRKCWKCLDFDTRWGRGTRGGEGGGGEADGERKAGVMGSVSQDAKRQNCSWGDGKRRCCHSNLLQKRLHGKARAAMSSEGMPRDASDNGSSSSEGDSDEDHDEDEGNWRVSHPFLGKRATLGRAPRKALASKAACKVAPGRLLIVKPEPGSDYCSSISRSSRWIRSGYFCFDLYL